MQDSLSQLRQTLGHEESETFNLSDTLVGRSLKSIRRIRQEKQDQDLLHRTLQDACQFAYGTKMIEVWVWDSLTSKLNRPEGGWWIDPYWQSDSMSTFIQFVDTKRHDYIAPPALPPGVGVPGCLWADAKGNTRQPPHRRAHSGIGIGSGVLDNNFLHQIFDDNHYFASRIAWRDLKALANDPDQPYNKRLETMASTDLRWCGGVPFSIEGIEGIVIYYARDGTDLNKLQDTTNTTYLMAASDFVGSCLALRIPRRNAVQRRQLEVDRNLRKVKKALQFFIRCGVQLASIHDNTYHLDGSMQTKRPGTKHKKSALKHNSNILELETVEEIQSCSTQAIQFIQRKVLQSVSKFRGAANKMPPPFGWALATMSAAGVLLSILCIGAINYGFETLLGDDYGIPLAPMAALLALQFGLTAAPAAQPRTILVGQVVSTLTALALAKLNLRHVYIQQSLATAVSIGLQAKLGVVHPPAAANAYAFASGQYGWTNMIMSLFANVIAILCSAFLNNLSDNRQYPTSWGIPMIFLSQAHFREMVEIDRDDTVTALLKQSNLLLSKKVPQLKKSLSSFGSTSSSTGLSPPPKDDDGPPESPIPRDQSHYVEESDKIDLQVSMDNDEASGSLRQLDHDRPEETVVFFAPGDEETGLGTFANEFADPSQSFTFRELEEELLPVPIQMPASEADTSPKKRQVLFADPKTKSNLPPRPTNQQDPSRLDELPRPSAMKPSGRHRRSPATMADIWA